MIKEFKNAKAIYLAKEQLLIIKNEKLKKNWVFSVSKEENEDFWYGIEYNWEDKDYEYKQEYDINFCYTGAFGESCCVYKVENGSCLSNTMTKLKLEVIK